MIAFWISVLFALSHVAFATESMPDPKYLDMLRATGQDAEFAKLMGIQDVELVRANNERSEGDMSTNVSPFGDILLTEEQARQGIDFNRYPGSKWPNALPYYVSRSDFTSSQVAEIERAIQTLNSYLRRLDIRQWRSGDNDYVYVISGKGCYSNLGRIGGGQTLSIQSNGCMRVGTIQHEFIHAAGVQHEHNRPDRDNSVRVLFENIPQDWQSQYQKGSATDYKIFGNYDYYSVMHYPMMAPGTNKPAFQILANNIDQRYIGQRQGPTQTDVDKLNKMYN